MVSFDGEPASKVDDVTALPSRHKMADMCSYGNVMTTTRWWLCVTILHLQQYSHRLNLFFIIPTDAHYYKNHRMLKQFKITTLPPTCFGSRRSDRQGAVLCLAKTKEYGFSVLLSILTGTDKPYCLVLAQHRTAP